MKQDNLIDLIGMIDDDMLFLAEKMRSGMNHEARKRGLGMEIRRRWIRNGLVAAVAVVAAGICLFASRYKLNEQYPVQLGTEDISSTEESIVEDVTTQAIDAEEESTVSESIAYDVDKMENIQMGFENAQSIIDYGQYRFYVEDMTEWLYLNGTILYAECPNGTYTITDKLRNGALAAQENRLYYAIMEDDEYRLMELNMDTLESKQLYTRPVEILDGEYESTFIIKGISGEYLIYSMGHPTKFSVENQQLYSYSLKEGISVALSAGEKTVLDGNEEYVASIHSEKAIPGILHVNRLTLDRVDGSDSKVLSELCIGIAVEGDILYYIEWADGEQHLVSYDMELQKELNRKNVSTDNGEEWKQQNGCFVQGMRKVLLNSGEIYEYSYGYISKMKDQYFVSELGSVESGLLIYRMDEMDGSLTAVEYEGFEKEAGKYVTELRLYNDRVYAELYHQNKKEICSWSWDAFENR